MLGKNEMKPLEIFNFYIKRFNEHYSHFLKNKGEKEIQERNENKEKPIHIGYIFKSNNQKSKNKK